MNLYILSNFNHSGQVKIEEWLKSNNNKANCHFFGEVGLFKTQLSNMYNQNAMGIIFSNGLNMLLTSENKIQAIDTYLEDISDVIPNNFGNISPIRFIFVIEDNLAMLDKKQLLSTLINHNIYDIVHGNNINDLLFAINQPQTKIKAKINNNLAVLNKQPLEVQKTYESVSQYPNVDNLYVNDLIVEDTITTINQQQPPAPSVTSQVTPAQIQTQSLDDIFNVGNNQSDAFEASNTKDIPILNENIKVEENQLSKLFTVEQQPSRGITADSLDALSNGSSEKSDVVEKDIEPEESNIDEIETVVKNVPEIKNEEVKVEEKENIKEEDIVEKKDIVDLTLDDIFNNFNDIEENKGEEKKIVDKKPVVVKGKKDKEDKKYKQGNNQNEKKKNFKESTKDEKKKEDVEEKVRQEHISNQKQQNNQPANNYVPSYMDKVKKQKSNVNYIFGSKDINVDFLTFLKSFAIKNKTLLIFSNGVDLDTDLKIAGFKYDSKKSLQNVFKKQDIQAVKENAVGIDNIDILYPENNRNAFVKTIYKLVEDVKNDYDKIIVLLNYNNFDEVIKKDNIYILEPNKELLDLNKNKDAVLNAQRIFNDCGLMASHIYVNKKDYL